MNKGKRIHSIKISNQYFDDVRTGFKPFEVRFNDRDYQIGDLLLMNEVIMDNYATLTETGRQLSAIITYVLDKSLYLQNGYVVLGITDILYTRSKPRLVEENYIGKCEICSNEDGKLIQHDNGSIICIDREKCENRYQEILNSI